MGTEQLNTQNTAPAGALREAPLPAAQNAADSEFFANRKEAWLWLKNQGYKVSRGKFYSDIQETGFPMLASDGRVSRYQVEVYGRNLDAARQAVRTPDEISMFEVRYRKEKALAEKAEQELEEERRRQDEYWLHATDAWSALAALIGELRRTIRRKLHEAQNDLIVVAGGEAVRAPDLFEELDHLVDQAFNEVADAGLDIQWEERRQ